MSSEKFHVVVINESTGKIFYMTKEPVTHPEGCVLLSKIKDYAFRRKQLIPVPEKESHGDKQ